MGRSLGLAVRGNTAYSTWNIPPHRPTNHRTALLLLSSSLEDEAKCHANHNTDTSRDVDALAFVRKSCDLPTNIAQYSVSRGKEIAKRDKFIGDPNSSEDQVAHDQANDTKDCCEYEKIPHVCVPLRRSLLNYITPGWR